MRFGNHFTPAKTLVYLTLIVSSILFVSCARGITPFEAANGKAKCGTYLK
jgi:hypothetical protein